jgi:hypothetical protein
VPIVRSKVKEREKTKRIGKVIEQIKRGMKKG